MHMRIACIFLSLFFALTPPAHATKAYDELLKNLAEKANADACGIVAEGKLSLQEAIFESAQENVRWIAVVNAMSSELRTHLVEKISGAEGISLVEDFLKLSQLTEDYPIRIKQLFDRTQDLFDWETTKNEALGTEKELWDSEIKHRLGFSDKTISAEDLTKAHLEYVDSILKIITICWATQPKAAMNKWMSQVRVLRPAPQGSLGFSILFGGSIGGLIGLVLGGSIDPAHALIFSGGGSAVGTALIYLGLKPKADPWQKELNVKLRLLSDLSPENGITFADNKITRKLQDALTEESFAEQVASGSVSLVDAVQVGAWELAVLEAEASVADLSPEARSDLALRIELYARQLIKLRDNYYDAAQAGGVRIPDPADDVLRMRLKKVDKLIDSLITQDQRLQMIRSVDDQVGRVESRIWPLPTRGKRLP